jgi:hypothetical protein
MLKGFGRDIQQMKGVQQSLGQDAITIQDPASQSGFALRSSH